MFSPTNQVTCSISMERSKQYLREQLFMEIKHNPPIPRAQEENRSRPGTKRSGHFQTIPPYVNRSNLKYFFSSKIVLKTLIFILKAFKLLLFLLIYLKLYLIYSNVKSLSALTHQMKIQVFFPPLFVYISWPFIQFLKVVQIPRMCLYIKQCI